MKAQEGAPQVPDHVVDASIQVTGENMLDNVAVDDRGCGSETLEVLRRQDAVGLDDAVERHFQFLVLTV